MLSMANGKSNWTLTGLGDLLIPFPKQTRSKANFHINSGLQMSSVFHVISWPHSPMSSSLIIEQWFLKISGVYSSSFSSSSRKENIPTVRNKCQFYFSLALSMHLSWYLAISRMTTSKREQVKWILLIPLALNSTGLNCSGLLIQASPGFRTVLHNVQLVESVAEEPQMADMGQDHHWVFISLAGLGTSVLGSSGKTVCGFFIVQQG